MKLLVAALLSFAPLTAFASDGWEEEKSDEGVTVFLKAYPGADGAKAFKAVTEMNAPYQTVVEVIGAPEAMRPVLHLVESSKVITPTTNDYALYLVVDMPWPVQDRDLVWTVKRQSQTEAATTFACGLNNAAAPSAPHCS